jgi:hypothetical protein
MKKNYLKGTAAFMVVLILTLPLYSASVLAALTNGQAYGGDLRNGYIRRGDLVNLEIDATITDDSLITASQLHLSDSSGPSFTTCTPGTGNSFHCITSITSDLIKNNPDQIRVALYTDLGARDDINYINVAFDELPPEIKSFTVSPKVISSGNSFFSYELYDHSYSQTDSNRCSGISRVELSYNGLVFATKSYNYSENQCSASGTLTATSQQIGGIDGQAEIILTAYDNFNQPNTALASVTFDTLAPVVDLSSLQIKDQSGNNIEYFGEEPITVSLSFGVLGDDLDRTKVYGDLSSLNPSNPTPYRHLRAACAKGDFFYTCYFNNIQMSLKDSTVLSIPIETTDTAGNTATITLTKPLLKDNIQPVVKSITTNHNANSINYVGPKTTFTVEIEENEAGLKAGDIKMDLSEVSSGLSSKPADKCEKEENWKCYWYDITADKSEGEKTVRVLESSTDLLKNKVTGKLSSAVVIDKTPPVIISHELKVIGTDEKIMYPKTNDEIDVVLNIKEKNIARAYGDFSSFVTTQDNLTGSCTKGTADNWQCTFSSGQIDVPGHIVSSLKFNAVDAVGNTQPYTIPLEVYENDAAENVSYWTSSVQCSPNPVDRQVTDLVNARVYCAVKLRPTTTDQETLSMRLGDCKESYEGSLGYRENFDLLNKEAGSTEPFIEVDLIKGEMAIDHLSYTCPIYITSRVGTKINGNPEVEKVKIDIGLYNNPLGKFGDGIQKQIDDAKDDAENGLWKAVGFLETILKYAKLICNALYMLHKLAVLWKAITTPLTMAHLSMVGTPYEPLLGQAKAGACTGDKTVTDLAKQSYATKTGDKWCKIINCQPSPQVDGKGGGGTKGGMFSDISESLTSWNVRGNEFFAKWPGGGTEASILSLGQAGGWGQEGTIEDWTGKSPSSYMNSRDNLLVALVTGCIPGIINGLDKMRQIDCLYAHCLEQNAHNNVLVKTCDDQKKYATCKYITGEIFAFIPYTALFDYYTGLIKRALSDPLTAIATVFTYILNTCIPRCEPTIDASRQWIGNEQICRGLQFAAELGEIVNDYNGIIDSYDQIKEDYCKRI